jgi:hypothetical protein
MDTLAVQLTLPPAGCVEDFDLQVVFPATTADPTAPVTALRAMALAHQKKSPLQGGDFDFNPLPTQAGSGTTGEDYLM